MSYAMQKLESLRGDSQFIFAVFYRGHWCPFCLSYLRSFAALESTITAAGGVPVIITAETDAHLSDIRAATGYKGEAINDPQNAIAKDLKKRGLVDVAISAKKGYENGMAQPAVLVLKKDETVLEKWAIVPGVMNLGGATDRPNLGEIWQNVEAKLKNEKPRHARYSLLGPLQMLREKIFG